LVSTYVSAFAVFAASLSLFVSFSSLDFMPSFLPSLLAAVPPPHHHQWTCNCNVTVVVVVVLNQS
jgi:hypothetical protein